MTEFLDAHCCVLIDSRKKISIGEKKNLAARLVKSRLIVKIDDDDFSLPTRFKSHLKIGIKNFFNKQCIIPTTKLILYNKNLFFDS
jgi:hypothetical protein